MGRLRQLFTGRYGSANSVNAEFENLVRYLNAAERGNSTVGELLAKLFDDDGQVSIPLKFQVDPTAGLQVKFGDDGDWTTLAPLSQIRGPAGVNVGLIDPLRPVDGLMFESQYGNGGGMIRWDKVAVNDQTISQSKVVGLEAALLSRPRVSVTSMTPATPKAGDFWVDTSDPGKPVLKYFNDQVWWGGSAAEMIPLPSPALAYTYLRVNGAGTGYELANFALPNVVTSAQIGVPGGIAPLGDDRKVGEYYLPNGTLKDSFMGSIRGSVTNDVYTIGVFANEKFRPLVFTVRPSNGTAFVELLVNGVAQTGLMNVTSANAVQSGFFGEWDYSATSAVVAIRVTNASGLMNLSWSFSRTMTG